MSDDIQGTVCDGLPRQIVELIEGNPILADVKFAQVEFERDGEIILIKFPNPKGKGVLAVVIPVFTVPLFIRNLQKLVSEEDSESRRGYA